MDERTTEGSPYDLDREGSATVPAEPSTSSWDQLALFGTTHAVIQPQFVIDAAAGSMAVSVGVKEFWSGDQLSLEVIPAMRFPSDLPVALAWIEQRIQHIASQLSPF